MDGQGAPVEGMEMKLVIPGTLPGLNQYIDACNESRYKANVMKRKAETTIMWAAKSQLRGVRFNRPVIMRYTWYEPNKKRDKDNIAFAKKFVQDALVRVGVLKNDGWAHIEDFSDKFFVDSKRPRVEVEIWEVES